MEKATPKESMARCRHRRRPDLKTLSGNRPRVRHLRAHSRARNGDPPSKTPPSTRPPPPEQRTVELSGNSDTNRRARFIGSAPPAGSSCAPKGRAALIRQCQHFWSSVARAQCHARFDCRSAHAREPPPRSMRNLVSTQDHGGELEREGWLAHEADAEAPKVGRSQSTKPLPPRIFWRGREASRPWPTSSNRICATPARLRRVARFAIVALPRWRWVRANTASQRRAACCSIRPCLPRPTVVRVWNANPTDRIEKGPYRSPISRPARREPAVESIGGFFFAGDKAADLTGSGAPERLSAALVTQGFSRRCVRARSLDACWPRTSTAGTSRPL
jgi:hypothetical protein